MLLAIARVAKSGHPGPLLSVQRAAIVGLVVASATLLAGGATALWLESARTPVSGPRVETEVPVTATDLIRRPSNNSPELAIDPTQPRFVVIANRLDAPFDCSLQVSGDGGRGWLTVRPVPTLPSGAATCYGPEVAFGSDGTLYYLFVGLAGAGNSPSGVFLATSHDRGRTFTSPRKILGPERYQVRMAIDPNQGSAGRMHLVWLEAGSPPPTGGLPAGRNPIMTAYSDDGGKTFSTPEQISDPKRPRAVAPSLAVGPNHSVDIVYYDFGQDVRDYMGLDGPVWTSTNWSLVLTRSTDGGGHFTSGTVVDSNIVPPGRVMLIFTMPPASIAVDDSGRLFAAWHDARNGDWDVFLRRSIDGGQSWDKPVRLNDDRLRDGRDQYLPRLSISPSGRIDAIFYDRRGDTDNIGTNVYYTWSTNGGQTFSRNVRLNEVAFSSLVGPRYTVASAQGLFEFGSRVALTSTDTEVLAAWTDTSNTRAGIKAQDIAATEIDFPTAAGSATALHWVGLSLTAIGVLGAAVAGGAWVYSRRTAAPSQTRHRLPGAPGR